MYQIEYNKKSMIEWEEINEMMEWNETINCYLSSIGNRLVQCSHGYNHYHNDYYWVFEWMLEVLSNLFVYWLCGVNELNSMNEVE